MFASQLASHLVAAGHEAIIVFVFPGQADLPFSGRTFHLGGNPGKRILDRKAWKKLANIIKTESPDIIQANAGDTLKYAVCSKLLYNWNQPIVFRNASTISLYIKSSIARLFHGFFFNYASRIISVSNTSASDFAKLFPQYKKRIVTIPIGIEEPVLSRGSDRLPTQNPPLRIIHVGGFSFEKNHRGLIRIFEKLLEKNPHAVLELVGNGILKGEIEALVRDKGLDDKVSFLGFRNDAMELIQKADVLILPSIIEGLPGVILEAFYCKTPVVANNVGGIAEIVINGETGYLIDRDQEDLFADAILRAATPGTEKDRLTEKAHELVRSQYLNTRVAKQFANTYLDLMEKKKGVYQALKN
jgi:glycosyltransferase involved in cell wall biosynthesis